MIVHIRISIDALFTVCREHQQPSFTLAVRSQEDLNLLCEDIEVWQPKPSAME